MLYHYYLIPSETINRPFPKCYRGRLLRGFHLPGVPLLRRFTPGYKYAVPHLRDWICVGSTWWSGNLGLCDCQFSNFHIFQFSHWFRPSVPSSPSLPSLPSHPSRPSHFPLRRTPPPKSYSYLFTGMENARIWVLNEIVFRRPSLPFLPVSRFPGNLEKRCSPAMVNSSRVINSEGSLVFNS